MENIQRVIDLLHKKKAIRAKQFAETKRKQTEEYNDLIHTLRATKDESTSCIETVSKNLQSLTTHKHSIYKLVHDSENAPGLPISHNYHRRAITFLSEGIDFVNKSQNAYKNFDNDDKENNVDSIDLINDIALCTNTVGSELYMVESLIAKVKTLQRNADVRILLDRGDEDTEV